RHHEVGGGLLRSFRSGVGEFPLAGDVAFGRILGPFKLTNFEAAAIDKNIFYFCFFVEEVAVSDDEICDFPLFDGAEAIENSIDFSRGKCERAQCCIGSKSGIDGFFDGLENVLWIRDGARVERELDARFCESGRCRWSAVPETESAQ